MKIFKHCFKLENDLGEIETSYNFFPSFFFEMKIGLKNQVVQEQCCQDRGEGSWE